MKNKRKQISNEISIRILSVVITIFVIFSIVVAIMIGNISLSSQKDELELQSKAASYQLETFFKKVHNYRGTDGSQSRYTGNPD